MQHSTHPQPQAGTGSPPQEGADRRVLTEADLAHLHPTVREALVENKNNGLLLAVRARWVSLAVMGIVLPVLYPHYSMFYYHAWLVVFAVIGWAQLRVGRVGRSRLELSLIILDLLCVCIVMTVPNPFRDEMLPTAYQFELSSFQFFYIFLAAGVLAYSWRTLAMFANLTTLLWLSAVGIIAVFGVTDPSLTTGLNALFADYPLVLDTSDPNKVYWPDRIREVILFILVAGILALNGRRTTNLIYRQAEAARERANLARYFAPSLVDDMAAKDEPLGQAREQQVSVMFVDIVGFTHQAEALSPQATIELLRAFHERLEAVIFEHGGTLDKFLGDGLMVTFGTPQPSDQDARNALLCGLRILDSIETWNRMRERAGDAPIRVSIGVHSGLVTIGDIGSERRMEYAVLGDAVNVASRLEAMTRDLKVSLVASDTVMQAALASQERASQSAGHASDLSAFKARGRYPIRGREQDLSLWVVPHNPEASTA